jgi:outer membrane cobalamin receptor
MNGPQNRFWGGETGIQAGPWHGWHAAAAIHYLRATDRNQKTLLDRPNAWGNASLAWTGSLFKGDLVPTVSAGIRYWSEFWNMQTVEERSSLVLLPYRALVDVKASAVIMRQASVCFALENLLGNPAEVFPGRPLPVRLFQLGITWWLLD